MDKARKWTDKKLNQMEKEISDIYKKSAKDIYKKWDSFMKEADSAVSEYQKAYDEAKKLGDKELIKSTGRKLSEVKRQKTLQSDQYKEMLDRTTREMARVNQTALAYTNGQVPSVYAKNYAQIGEDLKKIEPQFKGATDKSIKSIINEDVIKKRITDGTIETPFMKSQKFLNIPKDMRWNTKQINSSVLQGILQGESMDKIAQRLLPVMHNNESASIRNARTIVTGAENAGRLDSYKRLEEEGVIMKKVWIATGDDRTRESHLVMDGQEVDVDEPFIDGDGNELDHPADPSAPAETVYNCRCSMRTHIVGFRRADGSIVEVDYEDEQGESAHEQSIREEQERRGIEVYEEPNTTEIESVNRFGEKINFSETIIEKHPEAKAMVETLSSEFDTKLKEMKVGSSSLHGGGGTQISGTVMEVRDFSSLNSTIHEFAHTISIENQTKFGLYDESDFWKEIKKVQREYKKDVGNDVSRWISTYEHSSKGSDEFLAEAFTHAILKEKGISLPDKYGKDYTYSEQVLEIVKKYFGKKK